ncbi:MAG: hypothetical protein C0402_08260 [Thermodesulfovibrio sp.]|nr:hypothetical protein [Thermodesulfovibrio sp.]
MPTIKSLLVGCDKIAIIDDSFDPPVRGDNDDKIEGFWQAIEPDKDARKELKELGIAADDSDGIGNDELKILWEKKESLNKLSKPFEEFIQKIKDEKEEPALKDLCNYLDERSISYRCFGPQDVEIDNIYEIVFIDYYLGPDKTESLKKEAVGKSISIARKLAEKYGPSKPLIILMTSHSGLTVAMQDHFRGEANIVGGMFYFIPKSYMPEKDRLTLELYTILRSREASSKIASFISSFKLKVSDTITDFENSICKLNIFDYAYIQKLSLEEEGHPFGDYMLWLLSEYFASLLASKLRAERNEVNSLHLAQLPSSQFLPSPTLTEVYQGAIFETILEDSPVDFGDLFVKDQEVRLVVTPQCDLVRSIPKVQSVVLLHGELFSHAKADPKGSEPRIRTELIEIIAEGKKESFRIAWYLKRISSEQFGSFVDGLSSQGFKRVARLKLPFALQIQNAFSSSISRIGVPAAPPIFSPIDVELFTEDKSGKALQLLPLSSNSAYLFYLKGKYKFVLKNEFILDILSTLKAAIENLDARIKSLCDGGDVENEDYTHLLKNKEKLEALLANEKEQLSLSHLFNAPKENGETKDNLFYITRGQTNIEGRNYQTANGPLWLNIQDA